MADKSQTEHSDIPQLVAHRGYAARYPENTLSACEAALQVGACFIEIDIQLTSDGIPVLFHDHKLLRTTGHDALITSTHSEKIRRLNAGHKHQSANGHPGQFTAIPTLAEFIELLQHWPQAQAFIEIKEESLEVFGHETVLDKILTELEPLKHRCIPISYNIEILELARKKGAWGIGWVTKQYTQEYFDQALLLAPDYLICNHEKTGQQALWPGPWQWVLYEVTNTALALQLHQRGAQLIETMRIGELMKEKIFYHGRCHA